MKPNDPTGFFNDPEFVKFLNGDSRGIPAHLINDPAPLHTTRSTGVDLDAVRTRLQEIHRSNMKVIS